MNSFYDAGGDTSPATGSLPYIEAPDRFAHVPAELKAKPRWVGWNPEYDKAGTLKKVPYRIDGMKASPTDKTNWTTFDAAEQALARTPMDGLGFVFNADGICGLDLDHMRDPESGDFTPLAHKIIKRCNS